ncbi:hypothetical protein [Breoghania sp.]|uniref:ImuA family protein n=1 Tax=Breoghania sp. TaxID=2065378 RepID=UPI002AAA696A|nr:hypothetical protein [Breoghania sp.]
MAGAQAEPDLAELRRRIAQLESGSVRPKSRSMAPAARDDGQRLGAGGTTGLSAPARRFDPGFGAVLAGTGLEAGLACGALHEIVSDETRQAGAAAGFALALVTRLAFACPGALLWVSDASVPMEAGRLHAAGLAQFGLDPDRIIEVRTHSPGDTLWALEEGLGCAGLVGVIGEFLQAPRALDLTASRRLALRAAEGGVTGFLVSHAAPSTPGAAATRWRIANGPSRASAGPQPDAATDEAEPGCERELGFPAWRVRLERNRAGKPAAFDLEWDCDERIFRTATHLEPVAAAPCDRQDRPQGDSGTAHVGGELIRLRFGGRGR